MEEQESIMPFFFTFVLSAFVARRIESRLDQSRYGCGTKEKECSRLKMGHELEQWSKKVLAS